ncbi:flagellin lysine-N-methylase [Yersinia rohdei]|uniref:flagellin lysine-N-methylase n=1 Tax=Yersinia rohdei TaxID=29485 RepID=UPI00119ECA72|nr:flagellin lysine-N-methylase [Yersinia rohdei]
MKELLITQPDFMETFRCAGTTCREHCCKNQHVTLDRNRYQKYIKSPYSEIKRIAVAEITVTQASLAAWANFSPDSQGNCPFLDEQRLCQIYKHAGANALSNNCATYPLVEHIYKKQKIKSMSLSCPEVTRQVLFSTNALTLRFSTINQYDYYKAPDIIIEERLVNRACAAITVASDKSSIEEILWVINRLLHTHPITNDGSKAKIAEIDNLRLELIEMLTSGHVSQQLKAMDSTTELHNELVDCFRDFIAQLPEVRGKKTLKAYAATLLDNTTTKPISHNLNYLWQQQKWLSCPEQNAVFRHYLLYRINHDQLAMGERNAVSVFNLQVIDYFFLKILLTAHLIKNGQFIEDEMIDIIYSYHACRESTTDVSQEFKQRLTDLATRSDVSILSLLV